MKNMQFKVFASTTVAAVAAFSAATADCFTPAPIMFDTPAENDRGAMILGNGELGALAWVSADGTLHTVLQNSDSWNEGGRHVKTGALSASVAPSAGANLSADTSSWISDTSSNQARPEPRTAR